jgi:hypothetical protein
MAGSSGPSGAVMATSVRPATTGAVFKLDDAMLALILRETRESLDADTEVTVPGRIMAGSSGPSGATMATSIGAVFKFDAGVMLARILRETRESPDADTEVTVPGRIIAGSSGPSGSAIATLARTGTVFKFDAGVMLTLILRDTRESPADELTAPG